MILLRIFKDSRAAGTAGVILLLIAIFIPSFIDALQTGGTTYLMPHTAMPFYRLIFGAIYKVPLLNHFMAMLIMMLISYTLIRIGVRDQLLQERSFMPAIFFILFTAALPQAREVSPALTGSLFYLLCFAILFEAQEDPPDSLTIFSASLFLALGSMFCLKLIWFVPLIWVSLSTLRPVTWRELLYPVIAYALLVLFLFTWYWGVMGNGAAFVTLMSDNLEFTGSLQNYHFSVYIYYGYFMLLVVLASANMVSRFQIMKTMAQNIYQAMFYMFLAGVLFFIFISRFDPSCLVYIAIPVTFVLSNYFHRRKSPRIHEVAMWILVGLAIYVQLMV